MHQSFSPSDKPSKGTGEGEKGTEDGGEGEGQGEDGASKGGEGDTGPAHAPSHDDMSKAREVHEKITGSGGAGGYYNKESGLDGNPNAHTTRKGSMEIGKVNPKLRHEVRRLFERTDLSEYSTGKRSGALDTGALASVRTGNINVFKQRREEDGIDSAVAIVIDVSGSMGGAKMVAAKEMSSALYDTLQKAGVAVTVLAFDDMTSVIVPFNGTRGASIKAINGMRCNGGTNDYFAMRYAHELLLGRREERKVCFVVTDGQGNVPEMTSQVKTGKLLGITSIGVGIRSDVTQVYGVKQSVRVDPTNIGEASFGAIKIAV